MLEEWGIFRVGPTSCKRLTVKSTLFCSAAERPFHHSPNSLENSTSHAKSHYVMRGIMSSTLYFLGRVGGRPGDEIRKWLKDRSCIRDNGPKLGSHDEVELVTWFAGQLI